MQPTDELEELRVVLDRIRTLLETLVVRGLRACGPDELAQLASFSEHLAEIGAGHLSALLSDLRGQIERDERSVAKKLLETQTSVRLLERLLTLRVVKNHYAVALAVAAEGGSAAVLLGDESGESDEANPFDDDFDDEDTDEDTEEDDEE
jgi:hypothetical protein